jgi:hypothetical protein
VWLTHWRAGGWASATRRWLRGSPCGPACWARSCPAPWPTAIIGDHSHTIPVPCIGMVRQGRRARGGTRYRAGRVHHPTGSPEQRVPPGPSSSICSRGTSTRRLTLPQPRSSGRSCGRSSGRTRARACCPPRRAESVIQRAVRRRQGRLMPLSGDRTERDLWVMSQPVAVPSRLPRLNRARHDQSPVPAIAPRLTPSPQLRRVAFTNSFTIRAELG